MAAAIVSSSSLGSSAISSACTPAVYCRSRRYMSWSISASSTAARAVVSTQYGTRPKLHSNSILSSSSATANNIAAIKCAASSTDVVSGSGNRASAPSSSSGTSTVASANPASGTAAAAEVLMQIHIPPLQSSLPVRVHPSFAKIRDQANAWMVESLRPASHQEESLVIQSQFPVLGCAAGLHLQEESCLLVTKFLIWTFLFDNTMDDTSAAGFGAKSHAALAFIRSMEESLLLHPGAEWRLPSDGHLGGQLSDEYRRGAEYLLSWWQDMRSHMSLPYQARFLATIKETFEACQEQVVRRQAGYVPDLHTYIVQRRKASGCYTLFVLLECFSGLPLDAKLYEHLLDCPLMMHIKDAANDHASWVNDLFSFKSEYANNDYLNIVSVLSMNHSSCHGDLQRSMDMASAMVRQREDDLAFLLKEARSSKALMAVPGMESFLRGVVDWLPGNIYWSRITARYHGLIAPDEFNTLHTKSAGDFLAVDSLLNTPLTVHLPLMSLPAQYIV